MQYLLTPYAKRTEPFVWWENAFNDQELDWIQNEVIQSATQQAKVGGNPSEEQLNKIRRSKVSWMHNNQDTKWIFEKLAHIVSDLNAHYYGFDLTGFGEALQMTNYDQSEQGMYGWHQDYGSGNISRKMSIVLQLTDPSQYEGGNLQILTGGEPHTVRKQRGLITVFPSYQLHQVTPVTKGSRQTLVAWISGPPFK